MASAAAAAATTTTTSNVSAPVYHTRRFGTYGLALPPGTICHAQQISQTHSRCLFTVVTNAVQNFNKFNLRLDVPFYHK
jgi:hypothetical protein